MVDSANTTASRADAVGCGAFLRGSWVVFVRNHRAVVTADRRWGLLGGAKAVPSDLSMKLHTVGHQTTRFRAIF
jgi:hypothetical protein